MTSLEARALALSKKDEVLATTFELIRDEASKGFFEMTFNSIILTQNQKHDLNSLGFIVLEDKIKW